VESQAPDFPRRLRGIPSAPAVLHVKGILRDCERAVAIVGSRAASCEATARAASLAEAWAARGHLIVSGGAVGVDAAAHRGAMRAGTTWAVLGSGVDVVYPLRHAMLFDQIVERGGAIVSPYEAGTPPIAWQFVRRNAIIAGLCDAVVVVAAEPSSGSLHTARAAAALGRPVLAVPGTRGTDRLIAAGAAACIAPEDLDEALAGRPRAGSPVAIAAGSDAAVVHAALGASGLGADDLAFATGLGASRVAAALFELDLLGLAIALPGRNYVRSTLLAEAC
jgi:DNA processing protein